MCLTLYNFKYIITQLSNQTWYMFIIRSLKQVQTSTESVNLCVGVSVVCIVRRVTLLWWVDSGPCGLLKIQVYSRPILLCDRNKIVSIGDQAGVSVRLEKKGKVIEKRGREFWDLFLWLIVESLRD